MSWFELKDYWHEIGESSASISSPGLVAGQVPYATSGDTIAGDPGLTYDPTTDTLSPVTVAARNVVVTALATPTITSPLVVNGTPGVTTYGYKRVDYLADGTSTAASAEVTIATGNATLSATNSITVSWPALAGSVSTRLYRTTGGTAPPKLLYTGTATSYVDTGAAGTAQTPATGNTTGRVLVGDGSAGAPGIAFASRPGEGFTSSSGVLFAVDAASALWYASINKFVLGGLATQVFWLNGNETTALSAPAAATLQLGAANSATGAAVSQTLQVQSNITQSNVAAPSAFTIIGPRGTGNAAVAGIALQTGAVQASGATAHVPTTRLNVKELHINLNLGDVNVYANNAAALAGGLVAGDLYRTGADPDPVMIVH